MKLIIAGGRDIDEEIAYGEIVSLRAQNHVICHADEIVSGKCPTGADLAGEEYAEFYDIPVKAFPADWKKHGRAAGPIRNREMAEYADALLLLWDGKSRGSASMKKEMQRLGKPVFEVIV